MDISNSPTGPDHTKDQPQSRTRVGNNIYIEGNQVHIRGNMAGRDLIVINLPPLTWWYLLPAILIPVLIAVAIAWRSQPQGPGPMTGLFNIAVADFGQLDERGHVKPWDDGARLSTSLADKLRDELALIPDFNGITQVRHEGIGPVQGSDADGRREAARQLAEEKLKANLVIYGNLEKRGDANVFVPEFYVTEIKNAEELVGPSDLGAPITVTASGLGGGLTLSGALGPRNTALVLFTVGLAYLSVDKPDSAVDYFEQAAQVKGWEDVDGKEVLYLFLGTAYAGRNKDGDLDRSRAAYDTAKNLNLEYARAYIGLGNLDYIEFDRSNPPDLNQLDRAIAHYVQAEQAKEKPAASFAEAKIHLSLGNAYVLKAQYGQTDWFEPAQNKYQQVVTEYEQRRPQLKTMAARAYFGLGVVYERWKQDYARAAEYYRKCIGAAEDDKGMRQLAETQLKAIEPLFSTATPTAAK